MEELRPGLWAWTAPHPEWTPAAKGWDQDVWCAALVTETELVLLDPLEPPRQLAGLAEGRTVSVVLTCAWHRRSAADCVEKFTSPVYSPAGGLARVGLPAVGYDVGGELPGGVVAAAAYFPEETILWLGEQRAVFAGDAFVSPPLEFQREWLPEGMTREHALAQLQPLRDLPAEAVIVGHGEPVLEDARAALDRALHAPSARYTSS